MKIAFLGLGSMGKEMAGRLVEAGHSVVVWNRSRAAAEALAARGATVAGQPVGLFGCDAVVTMLSDDAAVRQVVLADGFLSPVGGTAVHVNMATISVEMARELAAHHGERGVSYVSAPVFGRATAAAAGQLSILAAGPADSVQRVMPLLEVMGKRIWYLGEDPTIPAVVKVAGNFLVACAIEALSEAVALGRANGLESDVLVDILTSALFDTPVYKTYGALIARRAFSPAGFRLSLGLKDVRLALSTAEAANVPLPMASVLRDVFLEAVAAGDGELDWSAVSKIAARRAGLDPS